MTPRLTCIINHLWFIRLSQKLLAKSEGSGILTPGRATLLASATPKGLLLPIVLPVASVLVFVIHIKALHYVEAFCCAFG